ncbi:hypothetical protein EBQ74_12190 [bacterium]|nr:hypothetical protein [bacterium]
MKFVFLSGVFSLFLGCSSTPKTELFYTRVYEGTYDEVWLAALKAVNDYPLKVSNKDSGKIASELVNGPYNDLFLTPPESIDLPEKFRYSLRFNFAKLEAEDGQPLVRVRVEKNLEQFHDFYTGWLSFPSDGLEERLLLYRVEHILKMENQLAKEIEKAAAGK